MAEDGPKSGYVEKVIERAGGGCLVQGLGLLMPLFLGAWLGWDGALIGLILLFVMLVVGSVMAKKWRCGVCKNPVAGPDVRVCPTCKASLAREPGFFG